MKNWKKAILVVINPCNSWKGFTDPMPTLIVKGFREESPGFLQHDAARRMVRLEC